MALKALPSGRDLWFRDYKKYFVNVNIQCRYVFSALFIEKIMNIYGDFSKFYKKYSIAENFCIILILYTAVSIVTYIKSTKQQENCALLDYNTV